MKLYLTMFTMLFSLSFLLHFSRFLQVPKWWLCSDTTVVLLPEIVTLWALNFMLDGQRFPIMIVPMKTSGAWALGWVLVRFSFILGCIVVLDSPRQSLQQVSHSVQSWCRKSIREMSLSIENLLIKTTAWLCAIGSKQLWGEHLFYLYMEKRL